MKRPFRCAAGSDDAAAVPFDASIRAQASAGKAAATMHNSAAWFRHSESQGERIQSPRKLVLAIVYSGFVRRLPAVRTLVQDLHLSGHGKEAAHGELVPLLHPRLFSTQPVPPVQRRCALLKLLPSQPLGFTAPEMEPFFAFTW